MKSLHNFINEKLHVSKLKKEQIDNNLQNKIYYDAFGFFDKFNDEWSVVENWISDNNVSDVDIVCNKSVLKELGEFIDINKLNKIYDTSPEKIDICKKYYKRTKISYKDTTGENYELKVCDEMICIKNWFGIIYCIDQKIINNSL